MFFSHQYADAKMIPAWKVDLEERKVGQRGAPQPSSVCLRVSKERPPEFTGFGTQYGPRLLSLSSLDSCVKRVKTSLSDKPWLSHDQELGTLQPEYSEACGPSWNCRHTISSDGDSAHRHNAGQIEALLSHEKKKRQETEI